MSPPAAPLTNVAGSKPDESPASVPYLAPASSRQGGGGPSRPAAAAIALLEQAGNVIRTLDDRAFTTPSQRIAGGTIGKHFRHCLDHFAAALSPLSSEPTRSDGAGLAIDYDHRARNVPMETDRAAAIEAFKVVQEQLRQTDDADLVRVVKVRVMLTSDGEEAVLPSTFGRELAFASHHAVHHHAMIKAIAEEFGTQTPPEFGKAPSTIHFESCQS